MSKPGIKNWTYSEREAEQTQKVVIRAGENVICETSSVGIASQICRSRREISRLAMHNAFESRLHRQKMLALTQDIRSLMATLTDIAGVLKRDRRPREVTAAREKVVRTLREMKAKGYIL